MGEVESKAEFFIIDGVISEVKVTNARGSSPLRGKDLKDFEVFLENYSDKIVEKWVDYFVYHKSIKFERITKKIK